MAFTEKTYSTTFYAQLHDVNQPERGFGAFVNRVTVKEFDDGTRVVGQEVQKDMQVAVREGITLPDVLAEFNIISAARAIEMEERASKAEQSLEELKGEAAQAKAQAVALTSQVTELRGLLVETAMALKVATQGKEVAAVDASTLSAEDADAAVEAIKADNGKSWWNPLTWFR